MRVVKTNKYLLNNVIKIQLLLFCPFSRAAAKCVIPKNLKGISHHLVSFVRNGGRVTLIDVQ